MHFKIVNPLALVTFSDFDHDFMLFLCSPESVMGTVTMFQAVDVSALGVVLLVASLSAYPTTSQSQSCDDVNKIFPGTFRLQDGRK